MLECFYKPFTSSKPDVDYYIAGQAGAIGFKANGAGGGGTVTILAKRNQQPRVRRAAEDLGMMVLPSLIDTTGLQVWEVKH